MPENPETHESDEQEGQGADGGPAELRDAAERGRRHSAENRQLKVENALVKAGVDTDGKLGSMFLRDLLGRDDLDVDQLDTDQLRTEATEIGALSTEPEPSTTGGSGEEEGEPGPEVDDAERRSTDVRRDLAGGAPAGSVPEPDPSTAGLDEARQIRAGGGSQEAAAAAFFNRLTTAAQGGDDRATFDPATFHRR